MADLEKRVWGIHTQDDSLFLKQGKIAIGWREMGDLSQINADRDSFKQKYMEVFPDAYYSSSTLNLDVDGFTAMRGIRTVEGGRPRLWLGTHPQ